MQLEHIKDEICPHCGAEVIEEKKRNKHCNGNYNESRYFSCGLQLDFSPNFMTTKESSHFKCKNSPEQIKKKEQYEEAGRLLTNYIKRMNVSKSFKNSMLQHTAHVVKYA